MKAAQRGTMYMPRLAEELTAIEGYWRSEKRIKDGDDALVTARVKLPFEDGISFVINKKVLNYTKLLYVGDRDPSSFREADYETHGSTEFKEILAKAKAEGLEELELEGSVKCEALGYSLRHGTIQPVGEIPLNPSNPMEGSAVFRIEKDS